MSCRVKYKNTDLTEKLDNQKRCDIILTVDRKTLFHFLRRSHDERNRNRNINHQLLKVQQNRQGSLKGPFKSHYALF